jgi:hypothetical protein
MSPACAWSFGNSNRELIVATKLLLAALLLCSMFQQFRGLRGALSGIERESERKGTALAVSRLERLTRCRDALRSV